MEEIRLTSWGNGSLSNDLQGFSTIPGGNRRIVSINSLSSFSPVKMLGVVFFVKFEVIPKDTPKVPASK